MMLLRFVAGCACLHVALPVSSQAAAAQPFNGPVHVDAGSKREPVAPALEWIPLPPFGRSLEVDTGRSHNDGATPRVVFTQELRVPDWTWTRVYLADGHLGQRSYIRLTSLEDGDIQTLDASALRSWRGASAYFNGDAVLIELIVDPVDRDVFVRIAGVAGSEFRPPALERTLCGGDERTASADSRVCRIAKDTGDPDEPLAWCTAWQISNGALLTAGHCVDDDLDGLADADFLGGVIQFNVPASDCDGAPNHPPAADQYPIWNVTAFSYFGEGFSQGRDWAVFSALGNEDGTPHTSRGWYRMTNELPLAGSTTRVTGFGTDNTPAGCAGDLNAANQTNQSALGLWVGEVPGGSGIALWHTVDTTGGNSGSPIIWEAQNITIGIHTNGGCTAEGGVNVGTSFELDALETAIANFPGGITRYVDGAFPLGVARDGTVFRPWSAFLLGVLGTPANGTLSVVAGDYQEALPLTISTPMTIVAPVGPVTVGP